MGYFPFYIDIENKNCLVVGGGTVALRKIEKLLPFKPHIKVVAPKICNEIYEIEGIEILNKSFEDKDFDKAFMVITATDDKKLNSYIFEHCKSKNILINTVDDKEKCGFIFPALVKKNNITVGISTSGKSPLYARYLRKRIENLLDDGCDETVDILSKYRTMIKDEINTEENRKLAFERILELCLDSVEKADEEQILNIIEDLK